MEVNSAASVSSGPSTGRTIARIVQTGGGSNEHQTFDDVGPGEGSVEGHPPPHRVAQVDRPVAGLGQETTGCGQIGSVVGGFGFPMAGKIDGDHLMTSCESVGEPSPAASVLGEAVSEHDTCSGSAAIGVETHAPRMAVP